MLGQGRESVGGDVHMGVLAHVVDEHGDIGIVSDLGEESHQVGGLHVVGIIVGSQDQSCVSAELGCLVGELDGLSYGVHAGADQDLSAGSGVLAGELDQLELLVFVEEGGLAVGADDEVAGKLMLVPLSYVGGKAFEIHIPVLLEGGDHRGKYAVDLGITHCILLSRLSPH